MSILSAAKGVTEVINRCEFAKATGLLDLSNCSLMYVADAVYLVLKDYNIERCNLSNNNLKNFPKKMIEKFSNLLVLVLDGNELSEIPQEVSNWKKLKGLNLARNKLNEFPNSLLSMKNLMLIDLSYNNIKEINFLQISNELILLKQLNLTGNPLKDVIKNKILEESQKNNNKIDVKI